MGKPRPLIERFWEKVNKNGPTLRPGLGACWLWTASTDKAGYGQITIAGRPAKMLKAHRTSWEIRNGKSAKGFWVLHHCDNPPCVNPDHLYLGDHDANIRDILDRQRMPRGSKHHKAKLTESQVYQILALYQPRVVTNVMLAKKFGVSMSTVRAITQGSNWKHMQVKVIHEQVEA